MADIADEIQRAGFRRPSPAGQGDKLQRDREAAGRFRLPDFTVPALAQSLREAVSRRRLQIRLKRPGGRDWR